MTKGQMIRILELMKKVRELSENSKKQDEEVEKPLFA
jgi:hypothetical protein